MLNAESFFMVASPASENHLLMSQENLHWQPPHGQSSHILDGEASSDEISLGMDRAAVDGRRHFFVKPLVDPPRPYLAF